ncbi:EVI2B protein, partial [Alectura lathami]|nr:EVI2B protein [Alectura lathami]
MVSNQAIVLLFCGEIWKSLSTAVPPNVSTSESHVPTSTRSPTAGGPTTERLQTARPGSHKPGSAPTAATAPPQLPEMCIEPSNGSWAAAVIIVSTVLVSMAIAIALIILRKCCKRPLPVDSNWAGRSPFADGDTPDVFMDSIQTTKRSSVLSVLPWKWRDDAHVQHDPTAPQKPPGSASSQPAAGDGSATSPSAPAPEGASQEPASCPHPAECPELPPPPQWLMDPSAAPSQREEPCSQTEEPPPPPPELMTQEGHESLPQPEHPL